VVSGEKTVTREDKDRGGQFLFQHFAGSILRMGGFTGVRSWQVETSRLVHPQETPDGLLKVQLEDEAEPVYVVVEIATFPERRVDEQMLRDAMMVFLERGVLPEVLTLVLHPKGKVRVTGKQRRVSRRGTTRMGMTWKVVELWKLRAADLLAANDVGLVPWAVLTRFRERPEVLLRECRRRIDEQASEREKGNLLAVCQVLTRLRYDEPGLLEIFGGSRAMIESPLLKEFEERFKREGKEEGKHEGRQEATQDAILRVLGLRFRSLPPEVGEHVRAITDEERLQEVLDQAVTAASLKAFRKHLSA
jgi:predicted transposase YdaD